MNNDERFVLDQNQEITDLKNPSYRTTCYEGEGSQDQSYLREQVLFRRLQNLVEGLLTDSREYRGSSSSSLAQAIFKTVRASHFVAISSTPSIQAKFEGEYLREKRCLEDSTSISLFCDDVCRLLCDLYRDGDRGALDQLRSAVLYFLVQSNCCVHENLSSEHENAADVDYYVDLIGWPEDYGISGSEWRHGLAALDAIRARARTVRENPSTFSKYTVGFADAVAERWILEPDDVELSNSEK